MERMVSENFLNCIPFILNHFINYIIFSDAECIPHVSKRYHIFDIINFLLYPIINSCWFEHNNPTSVQEPRREFLSCMVKINSCQKTKVFRKFEALYSTKRYRAIGNRCEVTIS